ncbi:MAG TPA: hypothetical protein PLB05_01065 [Candidatus Omnitrophota bacterium]|nr:hypothetical protein [Candidatus Omnitrophota bacterium]
MIVLLAFALLIIAGSTIPAIKLTKKYKTMSTWDCIYPYIGIPLWLVLSSMLKIGQTATLSNFVIENFWITVISMATPWITLFMHKTGNKSAVLIAHGLTLLPVIFTVVLRLLMQSLPE